MAKKAPTTEESGDAELGLVGFMYDPGNASCLLVALVALTYVLSRWMLLVLSTCSRQILQVRDALVRQRKNLFVFSSSLLEVYFPHIDFHARLARCMILCGLIFGRVIL